MLELESIGWDAAWKGALSELEQPSLAPARVSEQHKETYRVLTERGEVWAKVTGRLRWQARHTTVLPAVGDWVAVSLHDVGTFARIHSILPRRSALTRKVSAEGVVAPQVVAANVDTAFLVTSLNQEFNPRRIERALTLIWESGATPVIVLNKADLRPEPEERAARTAEAEAAALGVSVHVLSARTGEGLEHLAPHLAHGKTIVLLGMSGVGKSTLVNLILGEERQHVQEIRVDDDRGRHTTTARHLLPCPGGGCLIDTPGLRAISLWRSDDGLADTFADITELSSACRFRDCGHDNEPGCRVRAQVSGERLAAYQKLQRGLEFQDRKGNVREQAHTKRKWRAITVASRRRRKDLE